MNLTFFLSLMRGREQVEYVKKKIYKNSSICSHSNIISYYLLESKRLTVGSFPAIWHSSILVVDAGQNSWWG